MTDLWKKQLQCLKKYSFERHSYEKIDYTVENFANFSEENMEYLCANREIGGLALLTGTGFQHFFSNNNWKDENGRMAECGLCLISKDYHADNSTFKEGINITDYRQGLSLIDGIVNTAIGFGENKTGYQTSIFTSQNNKNLMCLTVTNTEDVERVWTAILPSTGYELLYDKQNPNKIVYGKRFSSEYFTKAAFAFYSEKSMQNGTVVLAPGETVAFRFAFTTFFGEGENYIDVAKSSLELNKSYKELLCEHKDVFKKYWSEAPFIKTPDEEINKLFYRALYWELCQNGGEKNLAPEAAFASLCSDCSDIWDGHPFCYGSPGQAVESLLTVGRNDLAKNILEVMFRPQALTHNAKRFTDIEGAFCFAHENNIYGYEIAPKIWWTQRHIDGFVADLYRKYYEYNPGDKDFFVSRVYPVFRGVAQFYRGNLSYNKECDSYLFPEWIFLSEFGARRNTLDVVLNALYVFKQASEYASLLGVDKKEATEWLRLADKLLIPQNDEIYLQYLGDSGKTDEGGGYFGKRAQVYLEIPYLVNNGYIDIAKAKTTMTSAWRDNHYGEGMITFVAGWGAKAAARFGMGNLSLEMLKHYFKCNPSFICETEHGRPYFQCSFVKALISMLVQGDYGKVCTFCAVPDMWKNVSFANITTINGIKVSGEWKNGKPKSVIFHNANGDVLHSQKSNKPLIV